VAIRAALRVAHLSPGACFIRRFIDAVSAMTSLAILVVFLAGIALGYAIRAAISRRRRAAARLRYIETGSYRRAA
jgi:hypothetical protein